MHDESHNDIEHLDGLFVGQLNKEEYELFIQACNKGKATREYVGTSGFLGLAKVKCLS